MLSGTVPVPATGIWSELQTVCNPRRFWPPEVPLNQFTSNHETFDMIPISPIKPHLLSAFPLFLALATLVGCNAKVEFGSTANPADQGEGVFEITSDMGTTITDPDEIKRLGFPDLADITVHQKGELKPRETVTITLDAKTAQELQMQTNVFFQDTQWKEGDTIELVQTNAPDKMTVTSDDGIEFNELARFIPVDGRIILKLENKSDTTFYYELYQDK